MKENGDWEPIDECRAAWRERVALPHAEFEILLRRHMGYGVAVSAARNYDDENLKSRPAAAAVRSAVTALLAEGPLRDNNRIAAFFADDDNLGTDIHAAITDVGSVPANPARAAWAVQAVIAGLYDNMPKNFWCSHPVLEDGFRLALEDIAEPATHIFVSDLCAIHRLQTARRLVSMVPVALRTKGGMNAEAESNLYHLCAYMHAFTGATIKAVVANATAEYESQMNQRGVTALRSLLDRGPT